MPTVADLGKKFEEIRAKEMDRSMGRLSHLNESDKKAIEQLTKSIVSKTLHDPILLLRNDTGLSNSGSVGFLRKLFRLDHGEEDEY